MDKGKNTPELENAGQTQQIDRQELAAIQEIDRLQQALAQMVQQVQTLQAEKLTLERKLLREQTLRKAAENGFSAGGKEWITKRQYNQLQYRLNYLEKKYQDLAGSKLGRLTLNYWAWQGKSGGGKGAIPTFLTSWLFNRLPAVQESLTLPLAPVQGEASPAPAAQDAPAAPAASDNQTIYTLPKEQEMWALPYLEKIKEIPDSNGCRYYEKLPFQVGIVCDEFFYDSIRAAADFVYLTPKNWRSELKKGLKAVLFVSAWRGLNKEWSGLASLNAKLKGVPTATQTAAAELLQYCRQQGIPTVFYSKEDPPNYELFLDLAKASDYVFTSAKECIPYYNQDCGRDDVQAVCFGINPVQHNPIGSHREGKEDTVIFSGSWMIRYPDRCTELATIFDGVLQSGHGLHIIDRNCPGYRRYRFPEPYFDYTSPALPHDQLQKVHKLFDWAININSVKNSETMFANRSFELQANGILMLSNFSIGVNNLLPNVQMVRDSDEVAPILDCLTPEEQYEKQMAGVRSVMTGHTCFDRIAQLFAPTGLPVAQPVRRILVLADTLNDQVRRSFQLQSYPEKVLMAAGEATAEILAQYDMVTWFDTQAHYGPFYLEDMSNGFKYTACDYITKDAWQEGGTLHTGVEHNYVSQMGSKYRTLFWRAAFEADFLLCLDGVAELPNGYSIDHFQYDAQPAPCQETSGDWSLSVVVPVYNNGRHLYGKCFASLRRSSIFWKMEIILVDDGSTDPYTLLIEEDLREHYPNVRLFRFEDGGSGSASRPRNKGVELATAPYLTFLDPDNEAVCDGYARLLELAYEKNCDLAVGNMYKIPSASHMSNYYKTVFRAVGKAEFDNGFEQALEKTNFFAASIQAMVIRVDLLRDKHLEQVPGAAGQDTLFSWQLFQTAKRIFFLDLPAHIYYAETSGSVTNTVSTKFFQKLLLLQQPKADWLLQAGLMKQFMALRYNYYTNNWIFAKLARAEDSAACAKLVEEILDIFAPYYQNDDERINQFTALCKQGNYAGAAKLAQDAFPLNAVRPMPTLEERANEAAMSKKGKPKVSKLPTSYLQDESTLCFTNRGGSSGDTYAWVIIPAVGKYQKLYGTKYTKSPQFSYDFAKLAPGKYRVRAFLQHGGAKESEDVAYVHVSDSKRVTLLYSLSTAQRED